MYGNPPNSHREINVFVRNQMSSLHKALSCARKNITSAQNRYKTYYDHKMHGPKYTIGQKVWLYNPFIKPNTPRKLHVYWRGPFEITDIINDQTFRIRLFGNVTKIVHYNKLKPYFERAHQYDLRSQSVHESANVTSSDSSSSVRNSRQESLNSAPSVQVNSRLDTHSSSSSSSTDSSSVQNNSSTSSSFSGFSDVVDIANSVLKFSDVSVSSVSMPEMSRSVSSGSNVSAESSEHEVTVPLRRSSRVTKQPDRLTYP
jgi:hypothetical protein